MKNLKLSAIAAALVVAAQAHATLFNITYTSTSPDDNTYASGSITANYLGGGVYQATSGTFDVSSASDGLSIGDYTLLVPGGSPTPPNYGTSPSGLFYFDNGVYDGNPFLSNPGLLFTGPGEGTLELNLFSIGASEYQLYDDNGSPYDYNTGYATITPAPVPEASTMVAGALMLLPFGIGAIRSLRKERGV